MTKQIKADICVIGAGSGGLSVAAGASQLGRKVVLIEKGEMGGDCLNYGCIPSKALLAAAKHAHGFKEAAQFGINAGTPSVDYAAVMDHVHGVIAGIAPHDSQERFEGLGVTVLRDAGKFTKPRQVTAGDTIVEAKHFIIATGSSPFVPPIPGLDTTPYFTNETLFANKTQPDHLLIVGGGPIGLEMAQAHHRLGSKVTVIEGDTILNQDDPECAAIVREQLLAEGIIIKEQSKAEAVQAVDGGVSITLSTGETVSGSHLLMAVGRQPNVNDLGLEAAGIDYDRRGIKTNARLQTSDKRVYAIGDVAGGPQFTHLAGDHAGTIVRNVLFKARSSRNDDLIPRVTYSDPELASVGLGENAAREKYGAIKIARFGFDENDRARAERRTDGFIKVFTKKNGEIVGATLVGPNAGDLIQPWVLALANKRKIRDFTNYIAPYPTRGEINKRAASAWYTPTLFSDRTRAIVRLLATFD